MCLSGLCVLFVQPSVVASLLTVCVCLCVIVVVVVQVLDDKNVRRRFRASNYQSTTRVKPFICTMPMRLDDGWNQIQFNLSDFTRRAYGTNYIETLRVQVRDQHIPQCWWSSYDIYMYHSIAVASCGLYV